MTTGEQKADTILATVAEVAAVAGDFPSPASPALELFAGLEPIIGPEIVKLFGSLFHRVGSSGNPQQASLQALLAGHVAVTEYVQKMPKTQTSGQLLGGD